MRRVDRREFLAAAGRLGAGALALAVVPGLARRAVAEPPDLIERNDYPQHWETTLEALGRSELTPNDCFFVRSHLPVPALEESGYRLEVSGLVRSPLVLSLGDLRALPQVEAVHTLECAGNGRGLYRLPGTSGTQWEYGAVGTAAWGGVRLASLLQRARPLPEARHVWFEAADRAPLPQTPGFLRSIPLEKAMSDTLLALTMNGEKLPPLHGAPLRAVVPGWYAMASTKWLSRVRVEGAPSDNHFMARSYRYLYPGADPAQAPPVEGMKVKSLITRPYGSSWRAGRRLRVEGFAWAGEAGVSHVDVSSDGGSTWRRARLRGEPRPLAWRAWSLEVPARPGERLSLMARATDGAGETQPLQARPNAAGYANNSIHRVTVDVRG